MKRKQLRFLLDEINADLETALILQEVYMGDNAYELIQYFMSEDYDGG